MKPWNSLCALGVCLLSVFQAGCSGEPAKPEVYPVTGVVTQGGKPVDGARVLFVPDDQKLQPASAITDKDGKYSVTTFAQNDGAQPGSYKIKVLKYEGGPPPAPAGGQEQRFISYEEEQKAYKEETKPTPPAKNVLPKKYEYEDRSGLAHTVPTAPSTFDIKIE
ncbi:hypothetical protein Pan44_19660 [Caulifigura coniformis]|uniref:Carboxypeptidase regulatory-like domain-containing protein n=1 Tax=Caulifigura coniformis TaxID=2527983 RepID=A0A517SCU4_9PLAN|nr:carboxypeptidase-like regulatory domain-containing protein [Caulifigura coniformis]QDT53939.1 hypothetical protein Pan44_19660 [Caulifigura coniformis]